MISRYLDSRYSHWISADPVLEEYIPKAPTDEEAKRHNQSLPGMGGVFNTVNFHLYHYAANNPIHYIDPDGNDVTNKTDDYIIARLEDKITLKDGTKIDTVVLAPGDKYIGGIDGTRDKEGNYTKVSANHKNIVNYTVEKNNIIKFDDEKSKKINDRNDMIKKINNLPAINKIKGVKLTSGSYSENSDGGKFLSKEWDGDFVKDLDENFNNYDKAYFMKNQVKLREEYVITSNGEDE